MWSSLRGAPVCAGAAKGLCGEEGSWRWCARAGERGRGAGRVGGRTWRYFASPAVFWVVSAIAVRSEVERAVSVVVDGSESETTKPTKSRHRAKHAPNAQTASTYSWTASSSRTGETTTLRVLPLLSVYTVRAVRIYKAIAFQEKVQTAAEEREERAVTCPT